MVKRHPERLWVDPEFHKMLKVEAAMKEMPVLKYTKFLAQESKKTEGEERPKRRLFNFDSF